MSPITSPTLASLFQQSARSITPLPTLIGCWVPDSAKRYLVDDPVASEFDGGLIISLHSLLVTDLHPAVHDPGTPSALGLWIELFISTVALICGLHPGVFLMTQGDGVGHHLPLLLCSAYL